MQQANKLFISIILIGLAFPAYAFKWQDCPKPADLSTATVTRVFSDGIDVNRWDAHASSIITNGQRWFIGIASFTAKDDTNVVYQQAQQILTTISGEPFQVIGDDWKSPDQIQDSEKFFQCIYGTSIAPHAIVIASTKSLSDNQLINIGRKF